MRFRLARYFAITSIAFFVVIGAALGYFYHSVSLDRLVALQEAGNVNLTQVFANNLWRSHLVPLIQESADQPNSELGKNSRIPEIHAAATAMMRGSTTYKIKVYDTRGRTVYSSEVAQIGEDKSGNIGFQGAMRGARTTELVHRDKFSAFEQQVENRDLIQSYIPRTDPATGEVLGVFEVYSDVTPFLAELRRTGTLLAAVITLAFVTLFVVLYAIVRKAQGVIDQQAEEARLTHQKLAQSDKMASIGQLVAGVAHQLNTPIAFAKSNVALTIGTLKEQQLCLRVADALGGLARSAAPDRPLTINFDRERGRLSRISDAERDSETLQQMLGDVLTGLDQMQEMVCNLTDFSRIDREKVVRADLNDAVRTVSYIARSAIPTEVCLVEELGKIPPLECNPSQLNQAFLNLITNAAQAIDGAGTVTIRTSAEDEAIRIEIADTGSGIQPDVLPHIFDTYYTTKPRGQGTGLGLPIARDIVRAHGGDIQVHSTPGKGSVFSVLLPLQTGAAVAA